MGRHSRTRISRPLAAALGLSIVVGGAVYYHHIHGIRTQHPVATSIKTVTPNVLNVQQLVSASPLLAQTTTAVVTQTPSGPAAGESAPAVPSAKVPATQPAAVAAAALLPGQPISTGSSTPPADAAGTRPAAPLTFSAQPLVDSKAKVAAGDLLGARAILNDSLLSNRLSPADTDAVRHALAEVNQTVIFAKKRFKDDSFVTLYQVQNGDRLAKIADHHSVTWEALCRINGMADARKLRAGQWIKIPNGPFNCVITKSAYRLDLYLGSPGESGSLYVTSFSVGLGKDNSTPTGTWAIAQGSKAHPATYFSPRGEGVMAPDDPKNPLGGYWMGLTGLSGNAVDKNSYGIHGTIEPDSIGKQSSLGCIRLGHDDIALLYDLLVDGKSKVVVKD